LGFDWALWVGGGLRWPRGCFDEENKMILDVVFVFSTNPNRAYIANVGQDIPHDKISVSPQSNTWQHGLRWPRGCFDEENKMILDVVFVMCCHVLL
jgi:hypothetical protein